MRTGFRSQVVKECYLGLQHSPLPSNINPRFLQSIPWTSGLLHQPLSIAPFDRITTTASRFSPDKPGAVPQDLSLPGESSTTEGPKRHSIFHRLRLHPGRRSKTTPILTIRPATASYLPAASANVSRPGSSHSDVATVAQITEIMPQSLAINTPSSSSIKRQRSQELSSRGSRPTSSGQATSNGSIGGGDGSGKQVSISVKIPSYLDKSRASEYSARQLPSFHRANGFIEQGLTAMQKSRPLSRT